MSLDFYTDKIADQDFLSYKDEATGQERWIPEVRAMSFACMNTGIPAITEKNVDEFYVRYRQSGFVFGFKDEELVPYETVRKFIGLGTNASTKTEAQFNKDCARELRSRAQVRLENIKRQLREKESEAAQ